MGLPSRKETNNDHHQHPLVPDVSRVLSVAVRRCAAWDSGDEC